MIKNKILKRKILIAISEAYPFSYNEVERIYNHVNSFDKTILIISDSIKIKCDPFSLALAWAGELNKK